MRRRLSIGALVLALGMAADVRAGWRHTDGSNITVSTETKGPIEDCGQIRVRFGDSQAARAEEQLAAPASRDPLAIHVPAASGLYVQGGDRRGVSIRACKAALSPEDLPRISVSLAQDGQLSIHGPDNGDWLVYLLVQAPRDTAMDLEASSGPLFVRGLSGAVKARTTNGPLSLEQLSGLVEARAQNGPISVKNCAGTLDAEAVNGPISLRSGGGDIKLATQNGPISVDLAGTRWEGAGLVAQAVNGPLSVRIPESYRSGTRIESAGRSPFTCHVSACAQGRKSWDEESKAIEFGDSQMVVLLSTVNGPVSINGKENGEEE